MSHQHALTKAKVSTVVSVRKQLLLAGTVPTEAVGVPSTGSSMLSCNVASPKPQERQTSPQQPHLPVQLGLCSVPRVVGSATQQSAVTGAQEQPAYNGISSLPEQANSKEPTSCIVAAGEPWIGCAHPLLPALQCPCNLQLRSCLCAPDAAGEISGPIFVEGSLALRLYSNMQSTTTAAALLASLCCPITKVLMATSLYLRLVAYSLRASCDLTAKSCQRPPACILMVV